MIIIIEQVLAVGDYCVMRIIVQCACTVDRMHEAQQWLAVQGQKIGGSAPTRIHDLFPPFLIDYLWNANLQVLKAPASEVLHLHSL